MTARIETYTFGPCWGVWQWEEREPTTSKHTHCFHLKDEVFEMVTFPKEEKKSHFPASVSIFLSMGFYFYKKQARIL